MPPDVASFRLEDVLEVSSRGRVASGVLIPAWGSVLFLGEGGSAGAVVEEHERLHAELNAFTSFGYLLNRLGLGGSEMGVRRLGRAVDLCRTTHEVYATTISLWGTVDSADEALRDYPTYMRYLKIGRALSQGFGEGCAVSEYMVASACWAAMQPPLHGISFEIDDERQDPGDIAAELQPDLRLNAILERREEIDFSWVHSLLPPVWLTEPFFSPEVMSDTSYLETAIDLSIRLYIQFGRLLEEFGMPVLEWDGHRSYRAHPPEAPDPAPSVLAEIEGLDIPDYVPRLARHTLELTDPGYRLKSVERQRLDRRPPACQLYVRGVDSYPAQNNSEWDLVDFVLQEPTPHMLMVVRPVDVAIEQYQPHAADEAALRAAAKDGVLTALRVTYPSTQGTAPVTLLAPLTEYRQLGRLTTVPAGDGFPPNIFVSISFSCLRSRSWVNEWATPLQVLASSTILYDSLPSVWLASQEAAEGHDGLAFSTVRMLPPTASHGLEVNPVDGLAVEALQADGFIDQWTLFLGGQKLVSSLAEALLSQQKVSVHRDPARFPPHSTPVAVMSRLAAEEPWFDWDGLTYGPSGEIVEAEKDPAALRHCQELGRARRERQERWIEERSDGADTAVT